MHAEQQSRSRGMAPSESCKEEALVFGVQKKHKFVRDIQNTLGVQMLEMQERLQLCLRSTLLPLHEQLHHQQQLSSTILDCVECHPDDS